MSVVVIGLPSLHTAFGLSLTSILSGSLLTIFSDSTVLGSASHVPSGLNRTPLSSSGYSMVAVSPRPSSAWLMLNLTGSWLPACTSAPPCFTSSYDALPQAVLGSTPPLPLPELLLLVVFPPHAASTTVATVVA